MQHLHKGQRQSISQQTLPTEVIHQCVCKSIPLPTHPHQTQHTGEQRHPRKYLRIDKPRPAVRLVQKCIRANYRNPEKQVVVQQPSPPSARHLGSATGHLPRRPLCHLQQLMAAEKLNQISQVSLRNMHATTLTHFVQQDLWRNLAPATQHLEAHPIQLKVLVAHRVMDQPTGAATDTGTALDQLKLLSKLRQYRLRLHQTNR